MERQTPFPPRVLRAREFDEEAVRDFLVDELGLEIPRLYRYDQGIHEIHRRLISRFGDEHFARAMGVFQDLLENEDNANGLGDDGDLYRSWRHDYRMRKENLSEPGTPKFPGMVLPAPIPLHPVPRLQPYHRPLVALEEGCLGREIATTVGPALGYKRATNLPSRDLPLRRMADNCSKPGSSPPESFWFSGSLGRPDLPHSGGTSNQCCDDNNNNNGNGNSNNNNTAGNPTNKSYQLGFRDRVRNKMPRFLSKGEPFARDDGMYTIPPTRYASKTRKGLPERPRLPPLSFDGAGDRRDGEYSIARNPHLDLNVSPIPPKPQKALANQPTAFSSHSKAPSDRRSITSTNHPVAASLVHRSPPSSKSSFRNLTRDLISPGRSFSPADPQMAFDPLDPPKFNPTSSTITPPEISDPAFRYLSVMNANPFTDDRNTIWPTLNEEQQSHLYAHAQLLAQAKASQTGGDELSGKATLMSHSRSDGNVAFFSTPADISEPDPLSRPLSSPVDQPSRGRSRSPTKVQFVEDLRDEVIVEIPQSPPKRARSPMKKMFGENGWLGRSTSMKEKPSEQYQKTGFDRWRGKLKGLTEDVSKMRIPNPFHVELEPETPLNKKTPISLDPPAQAKLYSEIELMICVTANNYLLQQRREGRMSVESLTKVTEAWKNKGRPQVVEFQFDQATQRDLVLYNLKSFRFYGDRAENVITINSMMFGWKTIAKEMSIRTFCYPDSMIRKHLHDIYKILELLGAPLTTFLAFQDLQVKTLNLMRDEQQKRLERSQIVFGQEKAWYPPPPAAQQPNPTDHSPTHNLFPFQD